MGFLDKLLKKEPPAPQECVLIHLDATQLPDEFWTLQERLYDVVERSGAGEFDGNEIGECTATLFAYGPDAARLWRVMDPILREYPMFEGARVVLRRGGPGSSETKSILRVMQ
jgi:hypothetical protein